MNDMRIEFDANLAGLNADEWLAQLEQLTDDLGYFEPLGAAHSAAFIDAGPRLFVTFENAETVRRSHPEAEPRGFAYVRRDGWSHLTIISHGESWFRDETVYRHFDRLIDDGFFEDFTSVLFHGIGACGYAAAAFSVAAPGCTVLAIRPQATLAAKDAGFDRRFMYARRLDWQSRFGYAPDMVDGANAAFVAFDPTQPIDAFHAALFRRENVTPLRCHFLGNKPEATLDATTLHDAMIRQAMNGELTEMSFAKLFRVRKDDLQYQRGLFAQMMRRKRPQLAAKVAAYVLSKGPQSFFEAKLEELANEGFHPAPKAAPQIADSLANG